VIKTQPWGGAWRNKLQAVIGVCLSLAAVVVALVLLFFYLAFTNDLAAYRSAPSCASPGDALTSRTCRFSGQASLVSVHRDRFLYATVRFDAISDRSFSTSFPGYREPSGSALVAGGSAPAVVWAGRLTDLAGEPTVDNP
jgi:hypothetical protein